MMERSNWPLPHYMNGSFCETPGSVGQLEVAWLQGFCDRVELDTGEHC